MGRGRSKGKTQKGKASGSRRHPEAARLHAQEVNAERRADGKETKSTSSISRSQRRAQQHHEAKAKPVPAPTENRSRSPVRGTTAKAKAVEESSSYYEETDAEPSQPSAAPKAGESLPGAGRPQPEEPRASGVKRVPAKGEFLPKAETPKAGESLPGAGRPQPEEPRASGVKRVPAKGELLPKAESPTEDTAQWGQATGQGEPLPSPRTPSRPTTAATAAENQTSGDQGGKSGEPLPDESQATGAGDAPKEAAASKTEQVALQGTPLTTGARMWFPSQFPLTLKLVKQLQSGELLPEPIQLSRLGLGEPEQFSPSRPARFPTLLRKAF